MRYEHHHLPLAFWLRSPLLITHVLFPSVMLGLATHRWPLALIGPLIVFAIARALRSHVLITSQRLVLEGDILPREDLQELVISRGGRGWSFPIEARYRTGPRRYARLRSLTDPLRAVLAREGIPLRTEWNFFG